MTLTYTWVKWHEYLPGVALIFMSEIKKVPALYTINCDM